MACIVCLVVEFLYATAYIFNCIELGKKQAILMKLKIVASTVESNLIFEALLRITYG